MKKLLIIYIFCLLAGCNGGEKDNRITYLDPSIKKNFNYQKGSYWIYKDSISGQVDSFYSLEVNNTFVHGTNSGSYETLGLSIYQSHPFSGKDSISYVWRFDFELKNHLTFGHRLNNTTFSQIDLIHVLYPFEVGNTSKSGIDDTTYINQRLSAYMLNSHTYNEVFEIIHSYKSNNTYDCKYYLNDSLGMIKMVIQNPDYGILQIWELQRYHIVK